MSEAIQEQEADEAAKVSPVDLGYTEIGNLLANTLAAVKLGFHAGRLDLLRETSQDPQVIEQWHKEGVLGGISTLRFRDDEQLAVATYRLYDELDRDGSGTLQPSGEPKFRKMKADGYFPRTLEIFAPSRRWLVYRSKRVVQQGHAGGQIFIFANGFIEPHLIGNHREIAEAPDWMLEGSTEPQPEHRPKYKPVPLEDLLSAPPLVWQIRELLPAEGLAVIYGEPGSGKSFLVLDMLASIARGEPWGGQRTRKGVAVYFGLEAKVNDRVAAYLRHHSLTVADLKEKLHVFQGQPFNLTNPLSAREYINDLTLAGIEPSVVVFDTLARSMPGKDENSSTDMSAVIACAGLISSAFNCLTVLVHHSGKDATRGMRGHSSLLGAADAELAIGYDKVTKLRTVKATKMKDGEDGVAWQFRLAPVSLPPSPSAGTDEPPRSSLVVDEVTRVDGTATRGGNVAWNPSRRLVHQAFVQALTDTAGAFDAPQECGHEQWALAYEDIDPLREGLAGAELRDARKARALRFKRGVEFLQAERIVAKDRKRPIYTAGTST
jgi:hypothetical protein